MPEPLLTPPEAAAYLQVAVQTLAKWRARRLGPPSIKVGQRLVRYARGDLEAWAHREAGAEADSPTPAERQPGEASHVIALPPRQKSPPASCPAQRAAGAGARRSMP